MVDGHVVIAILDQILHDAEIESRVTTIDKAYNYDYKMGYYAGFSASHKNWREKVSKMRSQMTIHFGR